MDILTSFLNSRKGQPFLYVFFDVGAFPLDGGIMGFGGRVVFEVCESWVWWGEWKGEGKEKEERKERKR